MTLRRIVSGGQTGVDRGALDAALAAGFACGGWCPAGRAAEDGAIDARYPLEPLASGGYAARTRRNVLDSDGTLIIRFGPAEGGTALTADCCAQAGRPCLSVDAGELSPAAAAAAAAAFVAAHDIAVLNVAGPRASRQPAAYACAREVVRRLIADLP